jgi:hypothetical protein
VCVRVRKRVCLCGCVRVWFVKCASGCRCMCVCVGSVCARELVVGGVLPGKGVRACV